VETLSSSIAETDARTGSEDCAMVRTQLSKPGRGLERHRMENYFWIRGVAV
jgi:hypothetical protein